MKYKVIALLLATMFFSCAKQDPEIQKQYLEGYWEIKEVEMPDKSVKNFDINLLIDHIEVNGDSGQRVKVAPLIDGTYNTNEVAEKFKLKIENDSLRVYYSTPYDSWKETIIRADDSILTVKNRDNKIYTYSKYVNNPIIEKQ